MIRRILCFLVIAGVGFFTGTWHSEGKIPEWSDLRVAKDKSFVAVGCDNPLEMPRYKIGGAYEKYLVVRCVRDSEIRQEKP